MKSRRLHHSASDEPITVDPEEKQLEQSWRKHMEKHLEKGPWCYALEDPLRNHTPHACRVAGYSRLLSNPPGLGRCWPRSIIWNDVLHSERSSCLHLHLEQTHVPWNLAGDANPAIVMHSSQSTAKRAFKCREKILCHTMFCFWTHEWA